MKKNFKLSLPLSLSPQLQLEGKKKKKKKKPLLDLTTGELKPAGSSEQTPPTIQDAPPTASVGEGATETSVAIGSGAVDKDDG